MLRKLFHISGIIIPVIYLLTDRKTGLVVAAALFCALSVFEVLRIKRILRIGIVDRHTKDRERKRPLGSLYYVLSAFIVIMFFERNIAVASLFTLSISDPLSSIIGSRFGRLRFLGKTVEGTLTFLLSSLCIFLSFSFGAPISVAAAVVASLAELLSGPYVDDNLAIPVATAAALTVLSKLI
jgi:dolichol kinase